MKNILQKILHRNPLINNYVLACGLLLIAAQTVLVTIQAQIDRDNITIGDIFTITYQITAKPQVVLEEIDPAQYLGAFEIKDFTLNGPRKKIGKEIRTYSYKVSTFLSGIYTIPSFDIHYRTPQGVQESIKTPELKVEIKPVTPKPGEPDDIRDIKPILRMPISIVTLLAIVCIIVIGLAGWLIWYVRKKRIVQQLTNTFEETRPPDVIALEKLQELKNLNLVAEGKMKEYYIIFSEIVRHYIERRFHIPVMDKTTFELYKDLRAHDITKKHSMIIKDLLSGCDLVKFAKHVPEQKAIDDDFSEALNIIEQTKEVEEGTEAQRHRVESTAGTK